MTNLISKIVINKKESKSFICISKNNVNNNFYGISGFIND